MSRTPKLGVNIDHVATLRQARYAPDPRVPNAEPLLLRAARECEAAGADSITVHLREDRRHIQDRDVYELREHLRIPLNLEMGNTPAILEIALQIRPDYVCLVPEHRREVTTEGGLDAVAHARDLAPTIRRLRDNGTLVSLFIDPLPDQVTAAARLGADMIELHTGAFANGCPEGCENELQRLIQTAESAHQAGLKVNAGHGINMTNLPRLLTIPHLHELNVGHHLVSEAIFTGLRASVAAMLSALSSCRVSP
ncbi:MAG: pyridoxine 5-phosphate synthase [Verrucomicrobia bacterium]|nr:MAG: pyridoxine 5-phosphate synthase [Verrucomicrobiota bacterium]